MKKLLAILASCVSAFAGQPTVKHQVDVVAAVLWAEARGEGERGIRAVAEVIHNRTRNRQFGRTPYEVVTKPKQFSCLNNTSPAKLVNRAQKSTGPDQHAWKFALWIAEGLRLGVHPGGRTGGALYYDSFTLAGKTPYTYTVTIGNHHFYK
jgi:N-acetylmuramoyl-L-alanine amidase